MCASPAVFNAMEALEHARQFFEGNANAGIAHCQDGLPFRGFQPHFNLALKRELESVAEEVENDLFPHIAVNIGWLVRRERRAMDNQSQAGLLAEGPEIAGEFGRQSGQVDGLVGSLRRARPLCGRNRASY